MATAENSNNAFLSLRARLRTPECSQQYSSSRVAQAARLDKPQVQEHLFSEFRKILATHSPNAASDKTNETISVSENYLLLEQLAGESTSFQNIIANGEGLTYGCCIAGSLATTGSNLHHRTMSEIDRVHEAVNEKIFQFSLDSDQVLAQTTSLYETIAQPLAELPCPSRDGQAETIGDQFSLLQEEFANADDRIQALYEKWQACVASEREAWQRLTSDKTGEPRAESELDKLVTSIDAVAARAEAAMKEIEDEYAEYIQIESLKVMQTLMEG